MQTASFVKTKYLIKTKYLVSSSVLFQLYCPDLVLNDFIMPVKQLLIFNILVKLLGFALFQLNMKVDKFHINHLHHLSVDF